jgi:hypothetical protein
MFLPVHRFPQAGRRPAEQLAAKLFTKVRGAADCGEYCENLNHHRGFTPQLPIQWFRRN